MELTAKALKEISAAIITKLAYRKKIHIRMDDDLHKKLRMRVANEGTTIQTFITNLLTKSLG